MEQTEQPTTQIPAAPEQTDTERRLRRRVRRLWLALGATGVLAVLCILAVAATLLYWHLYLLSPASGTFQRGPFLTRLDETSATLAWTLADPGAVELRATGPGEQAVTATAGRFTGLQPGTRYAWTAAVDGKTAASGTFRTAPPDLTSPVRFAVIGDYGSGNEHEWAVARVLTAQQPDFVLSAGDNSYLVAYSGLLDRNIFKPLHDLMAEAPLWATEGEHDLFLSSGSTVTDALHLPGPQGRWAIRYGPVQIVALGLQADAAGQAFAAKALAEPGPSVRLVLTHRPIQPGNPILPFLRRDHVAAIFAGHLHRYERRIVGGLPEFVVGVSGMGPGRQAFTQPSPDALISIENFGGLVVDLQGRHAVTTFLDERGRVLDRAGFDLPSTTG